MAAAVGGLGVIYAPEFIAADAVRARATLGDWQREITATVTRLNAVRGRLCSKEKHLQHSSVVLW